MDAPLPVDLAISRLHVTRNDISAPTKDRVTEVIQAIEFCKLQSSTLSFQKRAELLPLLESLQKSLEVQTPKKSFWSFLPWVKKTPVAHREWRYKMACARIGESITALTDATTLSDTQLNNVVKPTNRSERKRYATFVKTILKAPDANNKAIQASLMDAVARADLKKVKLLLMTDSLDLSSLSASIMAAAAATRNVELINLFLKHGVRVDAYDHGQYPPSYPPVGQAIIGYLKSPRDDEPQRESYLQVVKCLLQHGANPNPTFWGDLVREDAFQTAHTYDRSGVGLNPKLVRLLLDHGAQVTPVNLNSILRSGLGHIPIETMRLLVQASSKEADLDSILHQSIEQYCEALDKRNSDQGSYFREAILILLDHKAKITEHYPRYSSTLMRTDLPLLLKLIPRMTDRVALRVWTSIKDSNPPDELVKAFLRRPGKLFAKEVQKHSRINRLKLEATFDDLTTEAQPVKLERHETLIIKENGKITGRIPVSQHTLKQYDFFQKQASFNNEDNTLAIDFPFPTSHKAIELMLNRMHGQEVNWWQLPNKIRQEVSKVADFLCLDPRQIEERALLVSHLWSDGAPLQPNLTVYWSGEGGLDTQDNHFEFHSSVLKTVSRKAALATDISETLTLSTLIDKSELDHLKKLTPKLMGVLAKLIYTGELETSDVTSDEILTLIHIAKALQLKDVLTAKLGTVYFNREIPALLSDGDRADQIRQLGIPISILNLNAPALASFLPDRLIDILELISPTFKPRLQIADANLSPENLTIIQDHFK